MSWFKIDDGFHCHPKALAAGNAAIGLWTRLGAYSSDQLLDGFVPDAIAKGYGTRLELKRLLAVRLLQPGEHPDFGPGYYLHDYHDYNPTADTVRATRDAAAERQKRWRERKASVTPLRDGDSNGVSSPSRRDAPPTRPDPTRKEEPLHPKDAVTRAAPPTVDIEGWTNRRRAR